MKKSNLMAIGVVVCMLAACGSSGDSIDLSASTPDYKVSCTQILKEQDTNSIRATDKYENKIIQISGKVVDVDKNGSGVNYINLQNNDGWRLNICKLYDISETAVRDTSKGDRVIFTCNNYKEDWTGTLTLSNCSKKPLR